MMQSNNELGESLTAGSGGGGDDNASQSSQRSGTSLLDRIRAQQRNENMQVVGDSNSNTNMAPTQQIQVPQYSQVPTGFGGGGGEEEEAGGASSSNFLRNAWSTGMASMENGMATMQQGQDEEGQGDGMDDALLAPSAHRHNHAADEDYSMSEYFMTFVRDIYALFLSMPVWGRLLVVVILLAIALKLL